MGSHPVCKPTQCDMDTWCWTPRAEILQTAVQPRLEKSYQNQVITPVVFYNVSYNYKQVQGSDLWPQLLMSRCNKFFDDDEKTVWLIIKFCFLWFPAARFAKPLVVNWWFIRFEARLKFIYFAFLTVNYITRPSSADGVCSAVVKDHVFIKGHFLLGKKNRS